MRERFDREEAAACWDTPPALEPRDTHVRVWRREETLYYREIPALEAELLWRLKRGEDFGALCEGVAQRLGEEVAAARTVGSLEAWLSAGLLSTLGRS